MQDQSIKFSFFKFQITDLICAYLLFLSRMIATYAAVTAGTKLLVKKLKQV